MNIKVLIAFALGIVLALGVSLVVRRDPAPPPAAVTATQPPEPTVAEPVVPGQPLNPPAPTQAAPEATPEAKPAATASAKPAPKPSRPSPMPSATTSPKPSAPAEAKPAPQAEPPAPTPVETAKNDPPPPAPEPAPSPVFKPDPPKARVPKTITIPAGTVLNVRLVERITSSEHTNGDTFSATMDQPLIVEGLVIAERGARVEGAIVESVASGRVKGRASLGLELKKFHSSDGQDVAISTDTFRKEAESSTKEDAVKVGAAAGIGAAIGAIAGGGKGAAIGAAIGGGAGTGGVLATKGKAADLPAETLISFRLATDVSVTEKLR